MPKFPHLNTGSAFPNPQNIDVFKYDNQFDYKRFNAEQMTLQICTVPWDVGEAHVGNRTISGIGNVVWFGSKAKRDAWFDAIPDDKCFRFTTKFKELHRDQIIDVPIPYDVASTFNYLVVRYNLFANDDSPVIYESEKGHREWFWFIREVEFVAPNTTRLHLLDDAFQTWMYDVHISGMILERGHAPLFSTTVDQFLENPVLNNTDLLTEDVNYGGDPAVVSHMDVLALNSGEVWACIATTANPRVSWGTKSNNDWSVPAAANYDQNGVPSTFVIAVDPDDLDTFLGLVTEAIPQFKQTVQGIFFAPRSLVTLDQSFVFAGVQCHTLTSSRTTLDLCEITKSAFGYDPKYAEIAKLYTSPYAHIEITDEHGSVDVIRIEDTTGSLDVSASLSLAWPFVTIDAHLLGTGGNTSTSVTFRNITERTFNISGTWYETLRSWKVPTFAVILDASREYDYATHFHRAQRVTDYTNKYNSALASAATAQANANASAGTAQTNAIALADTTQTNSNASAITAQTNANASALTAKNNIATQAQAAKSNADAGADTAVSNTAIQVAANSSITSRSNQSALTDTDYVNGLAQASQAWEAGYTRETVNNEIDASYDSAAISAAGSIANSAISGASSGGLIGAGMGLLTGAISGAASVGQTLVSANLKTEQAEASISLSQSKVDETSQNNEDRTTNQNSANTDNANTTNTASTGVTANSAATQKANATRTQSAANTAAAATYATDTANAARDYSTDVANAERDHDTSVANANRDYTTATANAQRTYDTAVANAGRDRSNAQSAITNDIAQAALRSPFVYGSFADGESATNKPMALFANIVTQSRSAISAAGDEFLRYGYMYDRQWSFDGNWNIGKHFTYWKLKDFWVEDLQVPDMYMDKLRFFLFGGVTIWSKPEDIGRITIYENM